MSRRFSRSLGGAQLTPATVDPNLKDSYTDEYTFGVEQEIAGDLRGYVTFVRKQQKNTFGRYDRLRTSVNVHPGPGRSIRVPTASSTRADDRTITVWETSVPPDTTDYYLTNKPIGDTYDTVEFGVTKRMSDHWQLISAFDWTKRNLSSLFSEDPNTVAWNSTNTQTTGWTFKASGSYVFNHGVMVAVFYNAMKGEPYGRVFTVTPQYLTLADPNRTTPLVQGNMTDRGGEGRDVLLARHQLDQHPCAEGIRHQGHPAASSDVEHLQLRRRQDRDRRQLAHRPVLQPAGGQPRRNRRPLQHALHVLDACECELSCTTVVLLLVSALLCAQLQLKSGVLLINVVATVVDGKGRTVPNLTIDDFIVEEDGQPQTITAPPANGGSADQHRRHSRREQEHGEQDPHRSARRRPLLVDDSSGR